MTAVRYPKLYHDDAAPGGGTWNDLAYRAYRRPSAFGLRMSNPWTISYAIQGLTGFRVRRGYDLQHLQWSGAAWADRRELLKKLRAMRPAHTGAHGPYYYERDIFRADLPRWRCAECGRRAPHFYEPRIRCSEDCRPLAEDSLSSDEMRLWVRLHESLRHVTPTCSQGCHDMAVEKIRREVLQLRRMREWNTEAKRLVQQALKRSRDIRKASRWQSAESGPPVTSAT